MSLSAIDSLQHAFLNLRANWQLVVVQFLQTLLVTVISVIGLLPIVIAIGFAVLKSALASLNSGGGAELLERVLEVGAQLAVAVVATSLIWMVAFVVYCYFQGGILGTLAAGERRARTQGVAWPAYRAFSMRGFFELSESLTWPIFWLVNLAVIIGFAAIVGLGLIVFAVFALVGVGSEAVSIGFTCLAVLVGALFLIILSAWMQLALAELATGVRGVLAAANAALLIAVRRLPAVALLLLLFLVASIGLGIVLMPLSMVLEFGLKGRMGAYLTGQAFVTLLQWLASAAVTVVWSATVVALVSGEHEATA